MGKELAKRHNMYYFAHNKKLNWKAIPKKYNTILEARRYIDSYIVVNSSKNKLEDYLIFTKLELDNWKKSQSEKDKIDACKIVDDLSKPSKAVLVDVLGYSLNTEKKKISITEEIIEKYQLCKNVNFPYYAYCYWEGGSNGGFCSLHEVYMLYKDQATSKDCEGFDIDLYRVVDGVRLECLDIDIELDITLSCNGKKLV
jgi:hypothetical protein